ncbi:hypothetical protein [Streptomyces sioyaensis]|uniref:hypothetical protein n=1 Tax=Streptomyces sioyaensis TaxID=67364 RepID=UPI001C2B9D45|nr:hypothetical protein [Streptomyces sioyaensis]
MQIDTAQINPPRTVSVLAYDGMTAFETGIVTAVFGGSWPELDSPRYELKICAEERGPLRMVGGATLHTSYGLDALVEAQTVIVPSIADVTREPSPELITALRRAHQQGSRWCRSAPEPSHWPPPAC